MRYIIDDNRIKDVELTDEGMTFEEAQQQVNTLKNRLRKCNNSYISQNIQEDINELEALLQDNQA